MNSKNENIHGEELVVFISHANVVVNPEIPVPDWGLSEKGIQRHETFNRHPLVESISSIYSSKEQKAVDAATILSRHIQHAFQQIEELGEMDRSSTGYLVEKEFEETADRFFASPYTSIRGWEKAIDAQRRIVGIVKEIIKTDQNAGNIAIVSHGGVGALLLCYLLDKSISRKFDQPANGGGNYFCFGRNSLKVKSRWQDISGA